MSNLQKNNNKRIDAKDMNEVIREMHNLTVRYNSADHKQNMFGEVERMLDLLLNRVREIRGTGNEGKKDGDK